MTTTAAAAAGAAPPSVSRYTYRRHFRAEILNSFFLGVFNLYEVVSRRGLRASDDEIVALTTAAVATSLLGSLWAYVMEGKRKQPFIVASALLGRGLLVLTAILDSSTAFLTLCCLAFLADTMFVPAQQSIFQANYDSAWRGRLHGQVMFWARLTMIAALVAAAKIMDAVPGSHRVLYPSAAVLGTLAYLHYAWIRVRRRTGVVVEPPAAVWNRVPQILREQPEFDRFERNFYLYGVGFHILTAVNVILLVDQQNLSFFDVAISRLIVVQVCMAVLAPVAGRYLDRRKAPRTAGIGMLVMSLYPLILMAAFGWRSDALVFAGFATQGCALAWVNASAVPGIVQFSKGRDAAVYMGIHTSAVGGRGLSGPVLGYAVYSLLGPEALYALASVMCFGGGWLMLRLKTPHSVEESSRSS